MRRNRELVVSWTERGCLSRSTEEGSGLRNFQGAFSRTDTLRLRQPRSAGRVDIGSGKI
jgi:hypothetical protein